MLTKFLCYAPIFFPRITHHLIYYIDNIKYKYSFYAELVEESSPLLTLF